MKKPSKAVRKLLGVVLCWIVLYLLAAFASYDIWLPLKAFEFIVGRAVFAVISIILFYILPPVDEIMEEIIP